MFPPEESLPEDVPPLPHTDSGGYRRSVQLALVCGLALFGLWGNGACVCVWRRLRGVTRGLTFLLHWLLLLDCAFIGSVVTSAAVTWGEPSAADWPMLYVSCPLFVLSCYTVLLLVVVVGRCGGLPSRCDSVVGRCGGLASRCDSVTERATLAFISAVGVVLIVVFVSVGAICREVSRDRSRCDAVGLWGVGVVGVALPLVITSFLILRLVIHARRTQRRFRKTQIPSDQSARPAPLAQSCQSARHAPLGQSCQSARPAPLGQSCQSARHAPLRHSCQSARPAPSPHSCQSARPAPLGQSCQSARHTPLGQTCQSARPAPSSQSCQSARPAPSSQSCQSARHALLEQSCQSARHAPLAQSCQSARHAPPGQGIQRCGTQWDSRKFKSTGTASDKSLWDGHGNDCSPNQQRGYSAPQGNNCAPQGHNCASQGDKCSPQGDNSASQGDNCSPQGDTPASQGDNCAPQGDNCTPQGDNCAPQGANCAPQGDNSAPPCDAPTAADLHETCSLVMTAADLHETCSLAMTAVALVVFLWIASPCLLLLLSLAQSHPGWVSGDVINLAAPNPGWVRGEGVWVWKTLALITCLVNAGVKFVLFRLFCAPFSEACTQLSAHTG
ncbi:hypothetical protein ACOMHN_010260 [Nucella lapillus]